MIAIDGLYHKVMGLPAQAAALFSGRFNMEYSDHAKRAANDDRYGAFELLPQEEIKPENVVEVEVAGGRAVKAVVRLQFDEAMDLVMAVLRPHNGRAFVKTVWLNSRRDAHRTLNHRAYRRPEKKIVFA